MAMFIESDLWVCQDCLLLIANGEVPADWTDKEVEDWQEKITKRWPDQSGVCCGDSDLDEEFGVLPCEFCGMNLAGSRHHCVDLKPVKED